MEEIKVKNERRVGTYTFGVMLILIGISIVLMTFTSINLLKYILMFWPIILILLGAEILYLNSKSDVRVKIDFISIILMCIILFFTGIFSIGNYFVNKVMYDNDFKSVLINRYLDNSYCNTMNSKIVINAENKDKVSVNFIKDDYYTQKSYAKVNFTYNIKDENNITKYINFSNNLYEELFSFDKSKINITNLPDFIENVEITIRSNDISNISYEGNIIQNNG